MKIDLDSLSLKELRDLHAQTARAIANFVDRKKQQAIATLEEQARALGYSLNELVSAAPARKRRPARAKYANPANAAETWTGRGRKPRWVEAALKSGRSLESMLIK